MNIMTKSDLNELVYRRIFYKSYKEDSGIRLNVYFYFNRTFYLVVDNLYEDRKQAKEFLKVNKEILTKDYNDFLEKLDNFLEGISNNLRNEYRITPYVEVP